ncbi:hypothetical protein BML2537_21220 [Providencia stuartii]|nr:hypothetical protein BML2537_21220 [Providencia stuartii]
MKDNVALWLNVYQYSSNQSYIIDYLENGIQFILKVYIEIIEGVKI